MPGGSPSWRTSVRGFSSVNPRTDVLQDGEPPGKQVQTSGLYHYNLSMPHQVRCDFRGLASCVDPGRSNKNIEQLNRESFATCRESRFHLAGRPPRLCVSLLAPIEGGLRWRKWEVQGQLEGFIIVVVVIIIKSFQSNCSDVLSTYSACMSCPHSMMPWESDYDIRYYIQNIFQICMTASHLAFFQLTTRFHGR